MNAKCMLAARGFTPLLVNLESFTSKPNADGGSKNCVVRKVEKAVPYFVLADKVTTDSSTDQGKEPQPLESGLIWDVVQPLYKLHRKFLNTFWRLQSRERVGEERCGRINALYKRRKILGVRVKKDRFR